MVELLQRQLVQQQINSKQRRNRCEACEEVEDSNPFDIDNDSSNEKQDH